jgi:hypothetical protein
MEVTVKHIFRETIGKPESIVIKFLDKIGSRRYNGFDEGAGLG